MYDDAWMPHMQRITWNGIALHGGPLPGYAASHGCVRMPFGFAEKLFDKTRIGMRVIISPNDAAPVEFSHPALLVPKAEAIAAASARAETLAREAAEAARAAEEAKRTAATSGAGDGIAHGVAAQAGIAQERAPTPSSHPPTKRLPLQRRTRPRRGPRSAGRRPRPGSRKRGHGSTPPRPTRNRRSMPRRRKGRRQGGRGQEGRLRQGSERGETRARAGLDLHQPRDAEALRATQYS